MTEKPDIPKKEIYNIRTRWKRRIRDDQEGWESVDDFVRWCLENGYRKGMEIRKQNSFLPHGPGNTFFYDKNERTGVCKGCELKCVDYGKCKVWEEAWIKSWNQNIYKVHLKTRKRTVPKDKPGGREKFKIYHPDEIRRMIHNG